MLLFLPSFTSTIFHLIFPSSFIYTLYIHLAILLLLTSPVLSHCALSLSLSLSLSLFRSFVLSLSPSFSLARSFSISLFSYLSLSLCSSLYTGTWTELVVSPRTLSNEPVMRVKFLDKPATKRDKNLIIQLPGLAY